MRTWDPAVDQHRHKRQVLDPTYHTERAWSVARRFKVHLLVQQHDEQVKSKSEAGQMGRSRELPSREQGLHDRCVFWLNVVILTRSMIFSKT